MAHFPFNGYISLAAQDQSAHCFQMTVNHTQEEIEDTVFGAPNFKARIVGFQDLELGLQFREELTDDLLDEDVAALFGTTFAVEYRYKQGGRSANNPGYTATMMLTQEQAGGTIGAGAQKSITLKIASGSITRNIA